MTQFTLVAYKPAAWEDYGNHDFVHTSDHEIATSKTLEDHVSAMLSFFKRDRVANESDGKDYELTTLIDGYEQYFYPDSEAVDYTHSELFEQIETDYQKAQETYWKIVQAERERINRALKERQESIERANAVENGRLRLATYEKLKKNLRHNMTETQLTSAQILASIRDTLQISVSDVAQLLSITRSRAFEILHKESRAEPWLRERLERLLRVTDQIKEAQIQRLDVLIHRPALDGESLLSLLRQPEEQSISEALLKLKELSDREEMKRRESKGSGKNLRPLTDMH